MPSPRTRTAAPGAAAPLPRRRVPRAVALGTLLAAAAGCAVERRASADSSGAPSPSAAMTALAALGVSPGAAPRGGVQFVVDLSRTTPISPYIYGMNALTDGDDAPPTAHPWYGAEPPRGVTLNRAGGNRWSAYNWENNYSNAGNDYEHSNDSYLSESGKPGEAVRARTAATFKRGAAMLATVPMLGHAAADNRGGTGNGEAGAAARLAKRFVPSRPRKGAPFAASPDRDDGVVYQDEFVAWLARTFPKALDRGAERPIFLSLDNEPDIWYSTHDEVRSPMKGKPQLLTYDEFLRITVDYASAVKSVAPDAVLFGPAVATWAGAATLGRWPSPDPVEGKRFFLDYYLEKLRAAERAGGRRLVDVLDLHWYPAAGTRGGEITNEYAPQDAAMVNARLQAPRSLWDPTYDEGSWVSGVQGGPIRLFPLLREKIAAHYPGTKIAVTEYYYGRGGDISGGIAQADVLGIFGREGVFAATVWPQANVWAYGGDGRKAYAYVFGAFRMFRDYDGRGAAFGSLGASASTSDPVRSSVYASTDGATAGAGGRVVLVAINKSSEPLAAAITVRGGAAATRAAVYTLTSASAKPAKQRDLVLADAGAFSYTMPPMSVSTLELRP
jgi:hypothetical protein